MNLHKSSVMYGHLIDFLKDYQQWIFYGAHEHNGCLFKRGAGLCGQFKQWLSDTGLKEEARASYEWLGLLYHSQGLSRCYPFHFNPNVEHHTARSGEVEYFSEAYANQAYTNPRRLAWVAAMINGEL